MNTPIRVTLVYPVGRRGYRGGVRGRGVQGRGYRGGVRGRGVQGRGYRGGVRVRGMREGGGVGWKGKLG